MGLKEIVQNMRIRRQQQRLLQQQLRPQTSQDGTQPTNITDIHAPRRTLSKEEIRQRIIATNLLSGEAWKDRANGGRISLMNTDRQNQLRKLNNQEENVMIAPMLNFWR